MIGYSKKNIENYPRECFWWKETACEQVLCLGKRWKNREVHRLEKKKKPGLKFNPGFALTGVPTTEPSRTFTDNHSLRSRRLEVLGERENGRARGRHERSVVSCVSPSRAPVFSCAHYFKAPAGYDNHLSTKETFFVPKMAVVERFEWILKLKKPNQTKHTQITHGLIQWFISAKRRENFSLMFNWGKRVAGAKLRGNWRLVTTNAGNVSLKNLATRNLAAGAKRGK